MAEIQRVGLDNKKGRSNSNSRRQGGSSGRGDAHQPSPPVVDPYHQELADAFKIFDRNGDGKISAGELGAVLRSLGDDPSDEDLQLMVDAVDADGDGHIDLQEFIELNRAAGDGEGGGTAARAEELRAAFHVFDIDKNNYISAEELHLVLRRLGQSSLTMEDCCRMINGVDSDGDGLVDFEEFQRMMTSDSAF